MKKILIGLLALIGSSFAIERINVGNTGNSIPLFSSNDAEINLDTSEIDTSTRWLFVGNRPIRTYTDTIGTAWMRCDDSAGTDSVGGRLIFYGNPHPEGKAIWAPIDSVSIAVASGAETQTSKVLVNSGRYQLIRAIIRNQLAPGGSAAEKTVCRNVRLNIAPTLTHPMP
jgi:hypothetical protein